MDTKTQIYPLAIEAEVIEALRQVYDPEIPVNIYELGLIYEIDVDTYGNVDIDMTSRHPPVLSPGLYRETYKEKSSKWKAFKTFMSPLSGNPPGQWTR